MIALDTNVLVRFLAEPETIQGRLASELITANLTPERPGFVSALVLAETVWVLEDVYKVADDAMRQFVGQLLNAVELVIEHADAIERALILPHRDIADCILHEIGRSAGCTHTVTFDRRFGRLEHVELLQ